MATLNTIVGTDEANNLAGTAMIDEIYGLGGNDILYGADSYDALLGGDGQDEIYGGNGNDMLNGENGFDFLVGQNGDDRMYGGKGNDRLYGESGADLLYGEEGNDILVGGVGNDTLNGGAGEDIYFFQKGSGTDVVNNWDGATDVRDSFTLSGFDYSTLWLKQEADTLEVSFLGSKDKIMINNFCAKDRIVLEDLDNLELDAGVISQLAQAMAKFNPESMMSTNNTLPNQMPSLQNAMAATDAAKLKQS
jgi:trimeric autotransporter adhesin